MEVYIVGEQTLVKIIFFFLYKIIYFLIGGQCGNGSLKSVDEMHKLMEDVRDVQCGILYTIICKSKK